MILGYEIMKNDGEDCSLSRLHCSRYCVAPGRKRYRWRLLDPVLRMSAFRRLLADPAFSGLRTLLGRRPYIFLNRRPI